MFIAKRWFILPALLFLLVLSARVGAEPKKIGALGSFTPEGGIVDLAGPPGEAIKEILVKAGDKVTQGQILVIFNCRKALQLKLSGARLALKMARDRGASELELAKIQVSSAAQDVAFTKMRYENFGESVKGSLAKQQIEQRKHAYRQAQNKLTQSRLKVQQAEAQTKTNAAKAQLDVDLAVENLALATLRAPSAGTIIEILSQPGEKTGGQPIVRMGDLANMFVRAEVYEGDVLKLKKGMPAAITSSLLPSDLTGVVHEISGVISSKNKVAEVLIRLDDSQTASRLINMEVDVSIELP